jgi:hypothetical protein
MSHQHIAPLMFCWAKLLELGFAQAQIKWGNNGHNKFAETHVIHRIMGTNRM